MPAKTSLGITARIGLALLAVGLLPIILVIIASTAAEVLGCRLDEGDVHPCLIWGVDIGGVLYSSFVFGWLALVSLPFAMLGLVLLGCRAALFLLRR